jgi:hypothetical protein
MWETVFRPSELSTVRTRDFQMMGAGRDDHLYYTRLEQGLKKARSLRLDLLVVKLEGSIVTISN